MEVLEEWLLSLGAAVCTGGAHMQRRAGKYMVRSAINFALRPKNATNPPIGNALCAIATASHSYWVLGFALR